MPPRFLSRSLIPHIPAPPPPRGHPLNPAGGWISEYGGKGVGGHLSGAVVAGLHAGGAGVPVAGPALPKDHTLLLDQRGPASSIPGRSCPGSPGSSHGRAGDLPLTHPQPTRPSPGSAHQAVTLALPFPDTTPASTRGSTWPT